MRSLLQVYFVRHGETALSLSGQSFTIDPASVGILSCDAGHPQRRVIALWSATTKFDTSQA